MELALAILAIISMLAIVSCSSLLAKIRVQNRRLIELAEEEKGDRQAMVLALRTLAARPFDGRPASAPRPVANLVAPPQAARHDRDAFDAAVASELNPRKPLR